MENSKLIDNVLKPKSFAFQFSGLFECSSIKVSIPDLSQCDYSVIGDWGPTYRVQLNHDFPIGLELQTPEGWQLFQITPKTLAFESPRDPEVRSETPLFTRIPWPEKDLFLNVYFNPSGEVSFAQVAPLKPQKLWDKVIVSA